MMGWDYFHGIRWLLATTLAYAMVASIDNSHGEPVLDGAMSARAEACDCESISPWTNYFVRPSGDDGNSGRSPEEAWQTLANVNGRSWQAGDRILLEGGATFEGNIQFDGSDGGSGTYPITLTSFGEGPATIACSSGSAIRVRNAGGIAIRNLAIRGPGRTDSLGHHGVHLQASDPNGTRYGPIVLDGLDISGFYQNGVYVESTHTSDPGFRDLSISNCTVHDNGLNGIFTWGVFRGSVAHYPHRNITVRDCRVFNNTGQPNWPSHSGSGIHLSFVDGASIEYCEAYNNGELNDACGGPIGIWAWEANRVVIQFNESHHNKSRSGCDGGGFDLDGGVTNSVMQYNYSHDNVGAGFGLFQFAGAHPFHNNVVRYNISEKEGMGGIHVWATNSNGGIQNTLIHNNTIVVGPGQEGGIVETDIGTSYVTGTKVFNNAIIASPGRPVIAVPHPGDWEFQNNAYWDPSGPAAFHWDGAEYEGLAAWRAASGHEAGTGIESDPKLIGAGEGGTVGDPHALAEMREYRIPAHSPLVDAGRVVATPEGIAPAERDFYGTPIPRGVGFNIGACEHDSGDRVKTGERQPS